MAVAVVQIGVQEYWRDGEGGLFHQSGVLSYIYTRHNKGKGCRIATLAREAGGDQTSGSEKGSHHIFQYAFFAWWTRINIVR